MKVKPHTRNDYVDFFEVPISFYDMDIYGHMSNINYFKFVDIAVANYLTKEADLNMRTATNIGVIVNSYCDYFKETHWPESKTLDIGIRINRLGNSSVEYAGALFESGSTDSALAQARFTHVWINRETRKPEAIPEKLRSAMEKILVAES